jgi:hypothetical protein
VSAEGLLAILLGSERDSTVKAYRANVEATPCNSRRKLRRRKSKRRTHNPATAATATTAPTRLFLLSTLPLALEKKSMVDCEKSVKEAP